MNDIENLDKSLTDGLLNEKEIETIRWTREDYLFYLTRRDSLLTLAKNDKIIAFCLSVLIDKESELYKIIVDKNFRSMGLGKMLLSYHLIYLKMKGIEVSFLEVAENNYVARKLYEGLGYKVINVRKNYYGSLNGFVMGLNLWLLAVRGRSIWKTK